MRLKVWPEWLIWFTDRIQEQTLYNIHYIVYHISLLQGTVKSPSLHIVTQMEIWLLFKL